MAHTSRLSNPKDHLEHAYAHLDVLEHKLAGGLPLQDLDRHVPIPERGVYIIYEPGENRQHRPHTRRVVRVGTHALKQGSKATLYQRLKQHLGTQRGGGNHRGSIFRLHTGAALMRRGQAPQVSTWGQGSTAPREIRDQERDVEAAVSRYLGRMQVLWIAVEDASGPTSHRGVLERNMIALLSTIGRQVDPPSAHWLGHDSARETIRNSGLWNVRHVGESYDPRCLQLMADYVSSTPALS